MRRRVSIDFCNQCLFEIQPFWSILLHIVNIGDSGFDALAENQIANWWAMGGAKGVQVGEGRGDGVTQLLFRIIRRIPGVNVKSGV